MPNGSAFCTSLPNKGPEINFNGIGVQEAFFEKMFLCLCRCRCSYHFMTCPFFLLTIEWSCLVGPHKGAKVCIKLRKCLGTYDENWWNMHINQVPWGSAWDISRPLSLCFKRSGGRPVIMDKFTLSISEDFLFLMLWWMDMNGWIFITIHPPLSLSYKMGGLVPHRALRFSEANSDIKAMSKIL